MERAASETRITIGEENREDLIQHCSLITASYSVENIAGTIGVLGPTRMEYSKIVALVEFVSKTLTRVLMLNDGK